MAITFTVRNHQASFSHVINDAIFVIVIPSKVSILFDTFELHTTKNERGITCGSRPYKYSQAKTRSNLILSRPPQKKFPLQHQTSLSSPLRCPTTPSHQHSFTTRPHSLPPQLHTHPLLKNESLNPQLPNLRRQSLQIHLRLLPPPPKRMRTSLRHHRAKPEINI